MRRSRGTCQLCLGAWRGREIPVGLGRATSKEGIASIASTQGKSNVFFGVGYQTYPSRLPLRNPSEVDKLRKQCLLLRRRRGRHCDEKRKVDELLAAFAGSHEDLWASVDMR